MDQGHIRGQKSYISDSKIEVRSPRQLSEQRRPARNLAGIDDRLAPAVVTAEEANAVTIGCVNRRVGVGISCVPGRYLPVKQGVDGLFVGAQIVVCGSGRVVAGHCHLCPRWFYRGKRLPLTDTTLFPYFS